MRPNESISCGPVRLYLINVTPGNTLYEIANITADIYLNNTIQFSNVSMQQNYTVPYWFNLTNGHPLAVKVLAALYNPYALHQYANVSITYR